MGKCSTDCQWKFRKEVIFRGDRNDKDMILYLKLGWDSTRTRWTAQLNYAKNFGGTNALYLNTKFLLHSKNTIIHTNQEFGIMGINATVNAENLMNNWTSLYWHFKGGNYNILHSTIANYWDLKRSLPGYGIYATNEYVNGTTTELRALNFNLKIYCLFSDKSTAIQFKTNFWDRRLLIL